MDCLTCNLNKCTQTESCGAEKFESNVIVDNYIVEDNQKIVQSAAYLVDNGKAGKNNRFEELVEFIRKMDYKNVGLAYCYGMKNDALKVKNYFKQNGIKVKGVSCAIGGISQHLVNQNCDIHNVSCNPLGQATQLNEEDIDFSMIMGICLGHDILLQKNLQSDFTTIVVKDRALKNNSMQLFAN